MRVVLIVLDSVGIGELPDAYKFGDEGSNTLGNIAKAVGGLNLPNLRRMGLGNIAPLEGMPPVDNPTAAHGKMAEVSAGKDTTTGHWEICGIHLDKPFPTYPNGFPDEIIQKFIEKTGVKGVLGNKAASGTEIIKELGEEHIRTGFPIVYTSADSVFQIAAHKEVIPLDELYRICRIARSILVEPHNVARVIARPFVGTNRYDFRRTHERRDFSVEPPEDTLLDYLKSGGYEVVAVGKIEDIFAGRGITRSVHTKSNLDGMKTTVREYRRLVEENIDGLVFTNLVDFDTLYGHRNNVEGYYGALKEFDQFLPRFWDMLEEGDSLVLTADHGNDPTTPSTDHSREYVPVLWYGSWVRPVNIGVRKTYSDLGQTIAELFGVGPLKHGESFLDLIRGD